MATTYDSEETVEAPRMGGAGFASANTATAQMARKNTTYEELFTAKASSLVKGVGHVTLGGDRGSSGVPLNAADHGTEIMRRSHDAIIKSRAASFSGAWETDEVLAGISPDFWGHPVAQTRFPAMYHQALESAAARKSFMATVGKNFTATNTNTAGTPYGLVPYDLLAPSRLN